MKTILALCFSVLVIAHASGAPSGFWDDLMRAGAKGDDAFRATGRAGHVADEVARGAAAGRSLSREVDAATDAATRARRLKTMLQTTLHQPDAALLRQIETLGPEELEAALVLTRGSRGLIEVVPDVASRARLLRDGGADLIAAIGLRGDDLTREATRLDALVAAGQLPARVAEQTTLTRFAEVMRTGSGGAWKFWQQYVAPHPKKWITGGALVVYLANPEAFHDAVGNITEEGTRRLTEILGYAARGALKGAAEGGQKAAHDVWREFAANYLRGPGAWAAWVGLAAVCWVIGMLLPRTRRLCLAPFAWLFQKSKS